VTVAAHRTFLIEHYRPGVRVAENRRSVARVREAIRAMDREGQPIQYRSSTIVPNDEYYLSTIEASSESLVRDAYARAGVPFERISVAISVGSAGVDDALDAATRPLVSGESGRGIG
jgi:hypothetical protein